MVSSPVETVALLDGQEIPASQLIGKLVQLHYRSGLRYGGVRLVNAETLHAVHQMITQKDLVVSLF